MCREHLGHRQYGQFIGPFIHSMCCTPYEQSKVTMIKNLEAFKSRLEDHLKHIDEKIAELEKEE